MVLLIFMQRERNGIIPKHSFHRTPTFILYTWTLYMQKSEFYLPHDFELSHCSLLEIPKSGARASTSLLSLLSPYSTSCELIWIVRTASRQLGELHWGSHVHMRTYTDQHISFLHPCNANTHVFLWRECKGWGPWEWGQGKDNGLLLHFSRPLYQ